MTTDRTGPQLDEATLTAMRIVRATLDALQRRADDTRTGRDGEWRNLDVRDAFLRGIAAIEVRYLRPGVIATQSSRGRDWSYVGGEALRTARTTLGITGTVDRVDGATFTLTYRLP